MPSACLTRVRLLAMSLLLFAAAVGCVHQPHAAHALPDFPASDTILIAPTEVSVDQRIPAGEIDGIVVDAYRGSPLSHAMVTVIYSSPSSRSFGVQSDEGGRFRITRVKPRPAILEIRLIGHHTETVAISGDSGFVVRAGIHSVAMRACGLMVFTASRPAISVMVRDAQTGVAPTVPVMLRVKDGRYADSATGTVSAAPTQTYPADSLELGAAHERNGSYDVRVTAPGYKPWQARGLRPATSSCYGVEGRWVPVWLLPTSQAPNR